MIQLPIIERDTPLSQSGDVAPRAEAIALAFVGFQAALLSNEGL